MKNVNIILQGKGGVGKSFIAALIAQYKMHNNEKMVCIDTDPINGTFSAYGAFNAKRLDIMLDDEINSRKFDELIELIAASTDADIIIDNGASSFVSLTHYLISNNIATLLADMGFSLNIHTVIAGSQSLLDTLHGFEQTISQFPELANFLVWLNPYWGNIEADGIKFEGMKTFKKNAHRIAAILEIPSFKAETYGFDLANALSQHATFEEIINDEKTSIMTKQRIKIIQRTLFDLMASTELI